METSDKLWFEDMGILFRKDRLTEFFPTLDMTLEEQMNSVVRFSIYSGVLLYLYNQNYLMLYLPIAGFALTKVIYDIRKPETENSDEKMENERIAVDNELEEELENNRTEIDGKECIKPTKNNPHIITKYAIIICFIIIFQILILSKLFHLYLLLKFLLSAY